jgi:hypothetical protein
MPTRIYRWLAIVPPLAMLIGVPFANRVNELVFGLPFLLDWIVGCVLLTSLVMAFINALDKRHQSRQDRAPGAGSGSPGGGAS